ncbi:hypothetical protein H4219_001440 [Mycoemilia scoparia]|uniref:Uncharacterized protein n=1 Tax=Mycoemilia scoparia TaxID=417184 RepID=A0A9W8A6K1_9FUNG|nr:hypothetical protein H4219_001440 [Mycoemilia scoparia]
MYIINAHIQRLAHSIHLVNKDQHKPKCDLQQRLKNEAASSRPDTPTLLDYNATYLRSILVPLIRKALKGFYDAKLDSVDKCDVKSEAKITMVIDQRADHVRVAKSDSMLMPGEEEERGKMYQTQEDWFKPKLTTLVAIAEGMRHNPNAKSLDWVHERQRLEKLLKPPINEMILCDPATGTLYEGLSSNFFVTMAMDQSKAQSSDYKDYKLVTAPLSTVLLGTVMRLVLEVCERDSVPIEYKNPSLMGFRNGEYNGAFITSTSRLVYPISTIRDNKNIACVTDIAGKIEGATDNVGSINGNVDKR